jgi:hypothetical protein
MTTRRKIETHPRVRALDTEPTDGWVVTLNRGWKSWRDPLVPVHTFGADTLQACLVDINKALPCACAFCR